MTDGNENVANAGGVFGMVTNALKSGPLFFVTYLVLAIPTYLLPYGGSNSALAMVAEAALEADTLPVTWWHWFCLVALIVLAWLRGGLIGRAWVAVLPIFAAIFDMVAGLNWIPLIPTGFQVATVILCVNRSPDGNLDEAASSQRTRIGLVILAVMFALTFFNTVTYENVFEQQERERLEQQSQRF